MTEEGYDLDFSAAVTSAASVLGPIIPPSIIMIIYASLMDVSVAALFIAGYLPGIIIGIFLMIMAYIISRRRKYPIHKERVTFNKALRVTIAALPALMLPFIIIIGIVSGAFTPTEASVVAAAYALVLSLLKKNLSVRDITRIVSKSMKISSLILFLIGTGIALGWILTFEQIPQKIATLLLSVVGGNPIAVLFMIFIILTLAGMFLDTAVSIIVLGPLLLNTAVAVGLHPLHFALIMVMTLCVGLITPPLGLSLFVVCGITNLKLEVLTKATIPFIIVESIAILIVIYFPSLTMFVPKMFGYYP
jgi:tripartite ATP-independent transporter DctM subunit